MAKTANCPEIVWIFGGGVKPLSLGCYYTGELIGGKAISLSIISSWRTN